MPPPLILFPHEPFSPRVIDSEFAEEYDAAQSIGFATGFYGHEALKAGETQEALAPLPNCPSVQRVILRGWMIPGSAYKSLYEGLKRKGYQPQTSPEAYEQALSMSPI